MRPIGRIGEQAQSTARQAARSFRPHHPNGRIHQRTHQIPLGHFLLRWLHGFMLPRHPCVFRNDVGTARQYRIGVPNLPVFLAHSDVPFACGNFAQRGAR